LRDIAADLEHLEKEIREKLDHHEGGMSAVTEETRAVQLEVMEEKLDEAQARIESKLSLLILKDMGSKLRTSNSCSDDSNGIYNTAYLPYLCNLTLISM
jgi:hypothetical protein